MILRFAWFSIAVLLLPCVARAASETASENEQLVAYLRTQTAAASRLLERARPLCPQQTFGNFGPLVQRTPQNALSIASTLEATRLAIGTALNLLADGKPGESTDLICEVALLRARAVGVLDPDTFAAFNNLAVILRKGGRVAEARALSEELLPIARRYPTAGAQSARSIMHNLATALLMQGQLAPAKALFRECIDNAQRLGETNVRLVGPTWVNLAKLLDQEGAFAEAETWHRRVLAARIDALGEDDAGTASSFVSLGENLTRQGKYAEGEKAIRQGTRIYARGLGERHLNTAFGLEALAQNLLAQGRPREALSPGEKSLSIRRESLGEMHPETAASNYQLSRIELALGHADAAMKLARAALRARLPASRREESALSADGRAYVRQNAGSAAFQVVRSAWALKPRSDDVMEEAFRATQRIPLSDTGDAFSLAAVRRLAGRSGLSSLVGDLERREDRIRWLDSTLAEATTAGRAGTETFSALKDEQARLAGEIRGLTEELRAKFPDYFELARAEPVSLAALRKTLREDEALLLMTPGSGTERGYVWAVSRTQVAWAELRIGPEALRKAITALLAQMDTRGRGIRLDNNSAALRPTFDRKAGFELYRQLFGDPNIQAVVSSKTRWILAPQGALLAAPFNALVAAAPEAKGSDTDPAVLRATHWLGLERALSFLPSVANLSMARRKGGLRAPASARPLFAMGDPVFAPGSLPRLPGTRTEIDMLVQALRARRDDVLLDAQATETELKKRSQSGSLEQARVVVFATHGLLAGGLSGELQEPALVLTFPQKKSSTDDGFLTASEAAQLRFDADWIVLSACDTAGSASAEGEGLTGLARAFLFAGGRALLVSQWRLGDDSAPLLTSGTFAAMAGRSPVSRAEALRESMRRLMSDASHDRARLTRAHPAVWAPMILVGGD
jgi:CHAT domain-containing protein/tetratricopeptide (TPR) repeat protein